MNPFMKVIFSKIRDFVGSLSQEIGSKEWKADGLTNTPLDEKNGKMV